MRKNLSSFKLDNQQPETVAAIRSNLTTELNWLENELNNVIASLTKSKINLAASLKRMAIKLDAYYTVSYKNHLYENGKKFFYEKIPFLRQVVLEIYRNKTLHEIRAIVDNFNRKYEKLSKETKEKKATLSALNEKVSELNDQLNSFEENFNKIIENCETDLTVSLEEMAEKLDDYITKSEAYLSQGGALPVAHYVTQEQVEAIRLIKEDFAGELRFIRYCVFYTISALPKLLRISPTEIREVISTNAEIYIKIVEAVNDKESAIYQEIIAAINDLPESVKESLSVLARRAKEKVTRGDTPDAI